VCEFVISCIVSELGDIMRLSLHCVFAIVITWDFPNLNRE
jgi:hypothetical protein